MTNASGHEYMFYFSDLLSSKSLVFILFIELDLDQKCDSNSTKWENKVYFKI